MKHRVFINADDFGLDDKRNRGVLYANNLRCIDKISLVVNSFHTEEAVRLSKENGFFNKIGLHINLTEGKPLTRDILNTDWCNNGQFKKENPRSYSRVFGVRYVTELRKEMEAQIIKFQNYGFSVDFVDFHNDIQGNVSVLMALKPLVKKYGIKYIRGIEPYLCGYYRRSVFFYLPLKFYYMFLYVFQKRISNAKIIHGSRNVNQYIKDVNERILHKHILSLAKLSVVEIITHPEMADDGVCLDRTNLTPTKERLSMDNTKDKINSTFASRLSIDEMLKL